MKKNVWKTIEPFLPIPLIAVFLWVYYLCNVKLGVYAQDDILYSTNLLTGNPLASPMDIVEGQIWHYFNWGGRTVAHTILQFLFLTGDRFIDFFNPFACLGFAAVGNLFVKKEKRSLWTLLAILSGIFALNTIWYETQLWQTGIANYLYLALIYMPTIYCYIREAEKGEENKDEKETQNVAGNGAGNKTGGEEIAGENKVISALKIPLFVILGLLSGWSNENIGPAIFLGMVACIVILHIKKRKVPLWMYAGAVATLAGSVIMILAPGNYARAEEAATQVDISGIRAVIARIYTEFLALFVYASHILPVALASVVFYKGYCREKWQIGDGILALLAILALGAMILTPHFPHRAIFGTLAFLLCFSIRLLSGVRERIPKALSRMGILFLWAAGLFRLLIFYFE